MDRLFARNIAIALCAVWAAGCGTAGAQDATNLPAAGQTADAGLAADNLPGTLDGEIARAHALRAKGNFDDAAKALGQLMLVAPDNPQVVGEYAKVLTQQGRAQEAVPFAKRAIELNGNDWTLYSALGVAYDQLDEHAQARQAYEHALSLRPGAPEVLNNYAVSRMLAGDLDGAQRLLAQASSAGGANDKIANNLAMLASMKRPAHAAAPLPENPAPVERATSRPAPMAPAAIASAAPRVLMQKVPVDPLAGAVASHRAMPRKFAAAPTHHPKIATAAPTHKADTPTTQHPPMLRTAADNQ